MRVITISDWILRIGVLLAIILGILLWTGNFDAIRPIHMLIGIIVVLALWTIGLAQGFQKGGSFGLATATFVVGLALVIVGLYQDFWLIGSLHWIIQVIHLLLGLSTIGLGEMIAGRTRRRAREASVA
ncbi:MAG: hypothetical protein ABI396_18470 [Ktedonobacteraceae bacterium]